MSKKSFVLSFHATPENHEKVADLAKQLNVSKAEILNRAVDELKMPDERNATEKNFRLLRLRLLFIARGINQILEWRTSFWKKMSTLAIGMELKPEVATSLKEILEAEPSSFATVDDEIKSAIEEIEKMQAEDRALRYWHPLRRLRERAEKRNEASDG